ncbi:3-oxoacyl-[acyl-carrier-protein] synthase III [Propionibacterium sp. oral taxon 192 str. F0372]|uniref:3-oxoacyl-[acyl-carrier-protein] synthase III C-terminal domain-containing protein n=1 Tax=Propionibacterium sp. oral taxon 192 TaxID=671222 RepID=UPI0003533558|nr:3-oxoacyl-[acyl-carrier-protein] synthase III C-terminal domain-containing protein [Propionibacterium sp. oral taxon 192]EPH06973.1 3-oxoacyl-[acyl-carrier-protein] synthase III [Propionibacterium sp. oral taxon 192 str. F0372]
MVSALRVRILATGAVRPDNIVTSTELDEMHHRMPGLSQSRSGVTERAWAVGETASELGAAALIQALGTAGLTIGDLDAVICASAMPEQPMPSTAVLLTQRMGVERVIAFDVNASCLSSLAAMESAAAQIHLGRWRHVAIVSTEIASIGLCHDEVETGALFGDGAAAIILGPSEGESEITHIRIDTFPQGAHLCEIRAGGTRWNLINPPASERDYFFRMDSIGALKASVRAVPDFLDDFLETAGCTREDLDIVVPHQASAAGLAIARTKLGLDPGKIVDILADHGNQVAASLPTTLHHAISTGRLIRGQLALLLGTGAGLAVGAALVRF